MNKRIQHMNVYFGETMHGNVQVAELEKQGDKWLPIEGTVEKLSIEGVTPLAGHAKFGDKLIALDFSDYVDEINKQLAANLKRPHVMAGEAIDRTFMEWRTPVGQELSLEMPDGQTLLVWPIMYYEGNVAAKSIKPDMCQVRLFCRYSAFKKRYGFLSR